MKKYKTGGLGKNLIEEIECEKETAKSIWIVGKTSVYMARKESGGYNYFDTWEEAHKFLIEKAEIKADYIRRQLELANSHLGNIKGLKNHTA